MGAAYVVEGSALDGLKQVAAVARRLGGDVPRRFLSLRGEQTGERWRQFVLSLEHWGAHATTHARITACESARATFAAYASAFASVGAFAT
jgi:heme oxygenase